MQLWERREKSNEMNRQTFKLVTLKDCARKPLDTREKRESETLAFTENKMSKQSLGQ